MIQASPASPRVFCIGKNYAAHVAELAHLGYSPDGECVVFLKPATSLVAPGQPVRLPADPGLGEVHHEAELVVRLGRGGYAIPEAEAAACVDAIALGLDLTLRDLQTGLKKKGQPWELAKAFDDSAPLGPWTPWDAGTLQDIRFILTVNGEQRQVGHTENMLFGIARQIAILSRTWELFPGDVIFTGTPEGVGPVKPGDVARLEGSHGLATTEWAFLARGGAAA